MHILINLQIVLFQMLLRNFPFLLQTALDRVHVSAAATVLTKTAKHNQISVGRFIFMMSSSKLIVNLKQTVTTKSAQTVWHHLNGLINVYKPAGVSTKQVKDMIRTHICDGTYSMRCFGCYFLGC